MHGIYYDIVANPGSELLHMCVFTLGMRCQSKHCVASVPVIEDTLKQVQCPCWPWRYPYTFGKNLC